MGSHLGAAMKGASLIKYFFLFSFGYDGKTDYLA